MLNTALVGPVKSAAGADAALSFGAHSTLRLGGRPLLSATAKSAVAHISTRRVRGETITVTRAAHVRGTVRVWACAVAAKAVACTTPRTLTDKATFMLPLPAGTHARLIAVTRR